jgi:hypothetical protein
LALAWQQKPTVRQARRNTFLCEIYWRYLPRNRYKTISWD